MRRLLLLIVLLAVVLPAVVVVPASRGAWAADVHGDDERDRYVGTGGLILPGTTEESTRREAAGCADCSWRMTSPCVASVLGNAFGAGCTSVVRGCPGGELLRAWLMTGGGPWRELGLVCVGDQGPLTVARAGAAARDRVVQGIPTLAPTFAPPQGVLAQLPVRFASGQRSGDRRWRMPLLGAQVAVEARPTWSWSFGDGAVTSDSDDGHVDHVYRAARDYPVVCRSTWTARFTVDGLGPFPVAEPVRQDARLEVSVGEGRAVLVPG